MDSKSGASSPNELPPPYYQGQQGPIGFAQPYPPQQPYGPQPPYASQPMPQNIYVQQPATQSTVHVVQPTQAATIVMPGVGMGTCPACRSGFLSSEFTCCGICLGIFFFPLGLICCFLMMERRCSNCRAIYG